jgi:hypothetical protein
MSKFQVKVYIVQKADKDDKLTGPVLAAKLTYGAAHAVAKQYAPAGVTCILADKSELPNNPAHSLVQACCN